LIEAAAGVVSSARQGGRIVGFRFQKRINLGCGFRLNLSKAKGGAGDRELFVATPYRVIDVTNPDSEPEGIAWWEELTAKGGEGMVVKPLDWIAKGKRGLIQPAVKCRGREYLRIIYGAEYTAPEHLERLRSRGLSTKRSLALREFALGLEALHRFVEKEPLYRVHECVFGVLALESEPVDPPFVGIER
jgi:protein phosphatase